MGWGQAGPALPYVSVSFSVTALPPPLSSPVFLPLLPFLFSFFIFLPPSLFPFHPLPLPLPLWAPPPQLLWQQLNARNKGRIQLGHQFPKQHPRVGRRRAGAQGPEQTTGQGPAHSSGCVCVHTLEGGAGHRTRAGLGLLQANGSPGCPLLRPGLNPGPF